MLQTEQSNWFSDEYFIIKNELNKRRTEFLTNQSKEKPPYGRER